MDIKTNHKILVSSLIWSMNDGYGRETVLPVTLKALLDAQNDTNSVGCDLLLVNNASDHPETIKLLREFENRPNCYVHSFESNYGWTARNKAIEAFMSGDWETLVLMDQDVWFKDILFLNKIQNVRDLEPDLHAFMTLIFKVDLKGEFILPSGLKADICREMLGGVHIFDRKVPERIGGYNNTDFPMAWGWSDPEMARRLTYSGLLDVCNGLYLDPIRTEVEHLDCPIYDVETAAMRNRAVNRYGMVYYNLEQEIKAGNRLYHPIVYKPATFD